MREIIKSILPALVLILLAVPAGAANINLSGTPANLTLKQGETKDFTITISADGSINRQLIPLIR